MADTDYIRNRTNDILRERIALGATQGGARRKRSGSKCPKTKHPRKGFTNAYGTRVKPTCVTNRKRKRGGVVVGAGAKGKIIRRAYTRQDGTHVKAVRAGDMMGYGDIDDMGYGEGCYMGACPNKMMSAMGAGRKRKVRHRGGVMAGAKGQSKWIDFVKHVQEREGIPYKMALQVASREWRC